MGKKNVSVLLFAEDTAILYRNEILLTYGAKNGVWPSTQASQKSFTSDSKANTIQIMNPNVVI